MTKNEPKPHDLRDDIYAPGTTVTNIEERFAGAEPPILNAETSNFVLVTPDPGKGIPAGQITKG
ncbi:MAG: hypothetical protein WDN01_22265 [Rhizomicrobium sp.]